MTLSPLEWMQVINGAITEDPLVISQGVLNWLCVFIQALRAVEHHFFFSYYDIQRNEKTSMTFKDEKYKIL